LGTLGVSLSTCTLPGQSKSDRIKAGEMEVGLGIHGEPGLHRGEIKPADKIVDEVLQKIIAGDASTFKDKKITNAVLMVNNLGGTTALEIAIIVRRAVLYLKRREIIEVTRIISGPLMTSLEMAGFSITLFTADSDSLNHLDAACEIPAWPGCSNPEDMAEPRAAIVVSSTDKSNSGSSLSAESSEKLKTAIKSVADALIAAESELTALDKIVGDGDCGEAFQRGGKALLAELDNYNLAHPVDTLRSMADTVRNSMGGSSGGFYDLALRAAANSLVKSQDLSA
jgi:triose/dihydroxyacetone kinase / FAD-AMP lyase (cyclizing)